MTRVPRSRRFDRLISGTTQTFYNGVLQTTAVSSVTDTSTIDDWHGRPVVESNLISTQRKGAMVYSGSAISDYNGGSTSYKFDNVPFSVSPGSLDYSPISPPNGWMLDLVAGTNPSRPVVTPLTLGQDLIDIPKQLKELGHLITTPKSLMSAKQLANHYLCAQFGWAPLIEDVKQLLTLQDYIAKRCKELNKLYSAGGMRRRLTFSDDTQAGSGVFRSALYGPENYFDINYDIMIKRRSWATIHWFPTTVPGYRPSDDQVAKQARRAVYGLTVEGMAKGAWDVIPWTWLLGWFTNIGKYTLAFSNTVPASHGNGCFMSESISTYRPKPPVFKGSRGNIFTSDGYTVARKTRVVASLVTPGINVPFLSTFRLSILGALFTQRTAK